MGKNVYSSEVKWVVVKEKLCGELTIKEIMNHGIKNRSQIEAWVLVTMVISLCHDVNAQYTFGRQSVPLRFAD